MDIDKVIRALKSGLSIQLMGSATIFIIEQMTHYMFIPGQVENFTMVVDLYKKSLTEIPLMVIFLLRLAKVW